MTNPNTTYICPDCGSSEHLEVVVHKWARVYQNEDGDIETDTDDAQDHSDDWDDGSQMVCRADGCGKTGSAAAFRQ
ncbi:hypothetical protein [Neptuniibacter sp. QD37_11]|uniref:hypothetical protein n=1 Tax=Neptuniibacter sp. QD37_11 TaxID=3398209 RepID=UPI0039F47AD4